MSPFVLPTTWYLSKAVHCKGWTRQPLRLWTSQAGGEIPHKCALLLHHLQHQHSKRALQAVDMLRYRRCNAWKDKAVKFTIFSVAKATWTRLLSSRRALHAQPLAYAARRKCYIPTCGRTHDIGIHKPLSYMSICRPPATHIMVATTEAMQNGRPTCQDPLDHWHWQGLNITA